MSGGVGGLGELPLSTLPEEGEGDGGGGGGVSPAVMSHYRRERRRQR
jgi:hypothetical protein